MRGIIRHWVTDKGYGFIKPETHGPDIFCHISAISGPHVIGTAPAVGSVCEFDIEHGQRGPQAANVLVLSEPDEVAP